MKNIKIDTRRFIKSILVGGVIGVTVVTGLQYAIETKKNDAPVDTNNEISYQELYEQNRENVEYANHEYTDNEGLVYTAPEGYHIEIINGTVYAVRRESTTSFKQLIEQVVDGETILVAPEGYTIQDNFAVKKTTTVDAIPLVGERVSHK